MFYSVSTTNGVRVTVETFYQRDYSNPMQHEYMFAYKILIENCNDFAIKLLSRKWRIYDSNAEKRIVEGEGVVGQTPVIYPNQSFSYVSGCTLKTEIGRMDGIYTFINLQTQQPFYVETGKLKFVAQQKLN